MLSAVFMRTQVKGYMCVSTNNQSGREPGLVYSEEVLTSPII